MRAAGEYGGAGTKEGRPWLNRKAPAMGVAGASTAILAEPYIVRCHGGASDIGGDFGLAP